MPSTVEISQAQQLLRAQKAGEAWTALGPLLSREPANIEALLLAGRIHLALDRPAEARRFLNEAVRLAPANQSAQFLLGFCLYVENDFTPALAALNSARQLKPQDGTTLLYLALTYEGLARKEDALKLYPSVLKWNGSAEAALAYARFLFLLSRFSEAEPIVAEALRRDPRSREGHYEKARLLFEALSYAQCAATAEMALQLPGPDATERQLHFLLARTYQKLGNKALSDQHRKAFESIPPRLVR